jgi:RNA polymerase sporulation-specific sigma factor
MNAFLFYFGGMRLMKLTKEQSQIAEDNIRLAGYMTNKWVKKGIVHNISHDEIFSLFSFALCKAAATFKEDRGTKFATYAVRCMENELKMEFRKRSRIGGENSQMNLEDPIHIDTEGNPLTLEDVFSNDDHLRYDRILDVMYAKEALKELKPREFMILQQKYFKGITQREIADKLDISQSYVSRLEKRIINKLSDWNREKVS